MKIFVQDESACFANIRTGLQVSGLKEKLALLERVPGHALVAAFEKLSEVHSTILHEATAATQNKAIEEHPSEVYGATAWCPDGKMFVMASEEQAAAFDAVAQPVFDMIEQDLFNA
jgi:hypothetical protein